MIKLIIFDLDGTLVDSLDGIRKAANHVLLAYGFEPRTREEIFYSIGNGARHLIQSSIPEEYQNTKTADEMHDAFLEHYAVCWDHCMTLFPGMPELLKALKTRGIRLTVNSNKPHSVAVEVVRAMLGEDTIEMVIGNQDRFGRKPSPEAAEWIMKEHRVCNAECIYVGDSAVDILTAKNAKLPSVAVAWGYSRAQDIQSADYHISHPSELLGIIEAMNRDGVKAE